MEQDLGLDGVWHLQTFAWSQTVSSPSSQKPIFLTFIHWTFLFHIILGSSSFVDATHRGNWQISFCMWNVPANIFLVFEDMFFMNILSYKYIPLKNAFLINICMKNMFANRFLNIQILINIFFLWIHLLMNNILRRNRFSKIYSWYVPQVPFLLFLQFPVGVENWDLFALKMMWQRPNKHCSTQT